VHLTPAAEANSPACASVIVHLPATLGKLALRDTDAQGTAAWGSPTAVLLRCGVVTPLVSSTTCFTIGGVDWLTERKGTNDDVYVLTTYGRFPGIQVVVDGGTSNPNVVAGLASAVGEIHQTRKCLASPTS